MVSERVLRELNAAVAVVEETIDNLRGKVEDLETENQGLRSDLESAEEDVSSLSADILRLEDEAREGGLAMTAFDEEEYGMMRGIWGELETMNRSLNRLVELLEHPPVVTEVLEVAPDVDTTPEPLPDVEDELARVKATRRANGWCLLCGATRKGAGEGCYEIESTPNGPKTWMMHSWPEDEPHVLHTGSPCETCGQRIDDEPKRDACIMPSCPNPRYTESGHCHHHRYLRGDAKSG